MKNKKQLYKSKQKSNRFRNITWIICGILLLGIFGVIATNYVNENTVSSTTGNFTNINILENFTINNSGIYGLSGTKLFTKSYDIVVCKGTSVQDDENLKKSCDVVCLSTDNDCGDEFNLAILLSSGNIYCRAGNYSINTTIQINKILNFVGNSRNCNLIINTNVGLNITSGFTNLYSFRILSNSSNTTAINYYAWTGNSLVKPSMSDMDIEANGQYNGFYGIYLSGSGSGEVNSMKIDNTEIYGFNTSLYNNIPSTIESSNSVFEYGITGINNSGSKIILISPWFENLTNGIIGVYSSNNILIGGGFQSVTNKWTSIPGLGYNPTFNEIEENYINITGNISANYFIGNGSLLTGIAIVNNSYYLNSNPSSFYNSSSLNDINVSFSNINKSGIFYPNSQGFNSDSLLVYYTGNNNALDYSGNGYNGTLTNSPTFINGRFGNAYNFNGVNQYVKSTNNLSLMNGWSVDFWVYFNTTVNSPGIFSIYSPIFGSLRVNSTGYLSENWLGSVSPTGSILQNKTWYNIAFVCNSTPASVYVNGVLEPLKSGINCNISGIYTGDLYVGSENNANFLNGSIDNFMLFNRSLNSSEVISIYESNLEFYSKDSSQLKGTDYNPIRNIFYNLGSSLLRWLKLWVQDIDSSGNANMTNVTVNQLLTLKPIALPACAATYNQTLAINTSSNCLMYCNGTAWGSVKC